MRGDAAAAASCCLLCCLRFRDRANPELIPNTATVARRPRGSVGIAATRREWHPGVRVSWIQALLAISAGKTRANCPAYMSTRALGGPDGPLAPGMHDRYRCAGDGVGALVYGAGGLPPAA